MYSFHLGRQSPFCPFGAGCLEGAFPLCPGEPGVDGGLWGAAGSWQLGRRVSLYLPPPLPRGAWQVHRRGFFFRSLIETSKARVRLPSQGTRAFSKIIPPVNLQAVWVISHRFVI